MRQFMLPDLGEGLEEAEIVAWFVNEGGHVVANQPLVSVETDKAVVEVPSPWSGTIGRLFGEKGDLIKVGAPLVEFAEGGSADTGTVVGEVARSEPGPRLAEAAGQPRGPLVMPAVRALARKLEVDLNLVQGSGPPVARSHVGTWNAPRGALQRQARRSRSEACGARWHSGWRPRMLKLF
jgi:2-oxoisovalerate dehydrogenase E2 component (dihydrolipoyl transacylase)